MLQEVITNLNYLPLQPVLGFAFLIPVAWALLGGTVAAGSVAVANSTSEPTNQTVNHVYQGDVSNSQQNDQSKSLWRSFNSWSSWLIGVGLIGGGWYLYKRFWKKK